MKASSDSPRRPRRIEPVRDRGDDDPSDFKTRSRGWVEASKQMVKRAVEGPGDGPSHTRWLRKLRRSAAAGAVASAGVVALNYVGPGVLAALGISNPIGVAVGMGGVSLLKDAVGALTRSDKKDFEKTGEAAPAKSGAPPSNPKTTIMRDESSSDKTLTAAETKNPPVVVINVPHDGEHGLKETFEIADLIEAGFEAVAEELAGDGIQPSDALKHAMTGEMRQKALAAFTDVLDTGKEFGELSPNEQEALSARFVKLGFAIRRALQKASQNSTE